MHGIQHGMSLSATELDLAALDEVFDCFADCWVEEEEHLFRYCEKEASVSLCFCFGVLVQFF